MPSSYLLPYMWTIRYSRPSGQMTMAGKSSPSTRRVHTSTFTICRRCGILSRRTDRPERGGVCFPQSRCQTLPLDKNEQMFYCESKEAVQWNE